MMFFKRYWQIRGTPSLTNYDQAIIINTVTLVGATDTIILDKLINNGNLII